MIPQRHDLPGLPGAHDAAPVPGWLRRAVSRDLEAKSIEDVAIIAGAAVGALDTVVRRRARWAGAWRQRLALAAAAATAKQARRVEDEAALRDAVLLTRAGDDAGPAGRMLLGWRQLAGRPADDAFSETRIAMALENLGHAADAALADELADEIDALADADGVVKALAGVLAIVERHGLSRAVGAWLADALLARRLGWAYAVPLLGIETTRAGDTRGLLAAQARAALRALDLSAELGRRADRLLGVAPKLRAKAADAVVERLLSDDAIVASEQIAGISDRGLRRLFDRVVELGAVRELSGRPTFRMYGL